MSTLKWRTPEGWVKAQERDLARAEDRKSPHKAPRNISFLMHAIEQVGEAMAVAYHILDDPEWPRKPLVKRRLRDLDERDPFMTIHTKRKGVVLRGGVLILRADGIAEERADLHEALVVLA